jgi:hypothetical protein
MSDMTEARVREILDGCEGVQGGPWKLDEFACYVWAPSEKGGDFPLMDEPGEHGRVVELRGWGYYTGNGHGALGLDPDEAKRRQRLTGEHVAHCDPDTVRSLCTLALSAIASRQPVEWQTIDTAPKIEDRFILIRFEHENYAYASPEDKHRWEEVCPAQWTNFNGGGWVWHGLAGNPTHWRPLPASPALQSSPIKE